MSGKGSFPQPASVPTNQQSDDAPSQHLEEQTALSLHLGAFRRPAAKPAGALLTAAAAVSLAAPRRGTTATRWVQVSCSSLIRRSTGRQTPPGTQELLLWTAPVNLTKFGIYVLDLSTVITSASTAVRNELWPGESTEAQGSSSGPFHY